MKHMVLSYIALIMIFFTCSVMAAEKPVRMAYLQNDIHHLALWVALEEGLFKKHGEEVKVEGVFRAGPEIMSAFAAGALDMAYVGEAPATTAVANSAADVTVVSQVNTEGSALVVATTGDSGINELADLAGRTVAVPGHSTVQDFLLQRALSRAGVTAGKVNIMVLKPPEMITALKTSQIDAFIAWEPYPAKAATMGAGRSLASSRQMWPDHPCCVLAADTGFYRASPKRVEKVLAAHFEATRFIKDHPDKALAIGVKYTGMDEDTVRLAMETVNYTCDLSISGEKEYVEFLSGLKYISVKDADAFIKKFIDPAPLEKIKGQRP